MHTDKGAKRGCLDEWRTQCRSELAVSVLRTVIANRKFRPHGDKFSSDHILQYVSTDAFPHYYDNTLITALICHKYNRGGPKNKSVGWQNHESPARLPQVMGPES